MRKKRMSPPKGDEIVPAPVSAREVNLPWPKIFLGVALIATVVGALFATKTLAGIEKNIADVKEAARPANVTLTKITASNCNECFNLDDAVANLKKQNVSIGEEKAVTLDSSEGKDLIKKLAIQRVPTYIVTGEVTKKNIEGFIKSNGEVKNDKFVFTKVAPIFIDPQTKKEIGKVTATLLTDPSCTECTDPKLTVEAYKKAGIKITDQKELVWNSQDAQQIITQYKITKVPTFLLSSGVDFYDAVKANWTRFGTVEQDKTYVARNLLLPYRDLEKGQIVGLVDIVYLTDSTCSDCYKPEVTQKSILTQRFGVGIASEGIVDVGSFEGQNLVRRYKITKVPTVLISSGADQYVSLKNVWKSVGTVEKDGWYVFREMARVGRITYKDLTSNQIINPAQPSVSPSPTGTSK